MLKWHKNYYRGASIKNISKIRLKLIQGKPVPGIYLITLSENPHNQLEILPTLTLVQETAARICPEIVGIAKGKEEALELITDMVQTIYEETIHTTEMERKRRKKKLPSVMTSTESGNSTMPATTEVRFRDSKKKNIAAETGTISAYRHISRWKDMMRHSMPMYSIRGKAMKISIRARFRNILTRLQAM